jgi:hypothetical protein
MSVFAQAAVEGKGGSGLVVLAVAVLLVLYLVVTRRSARSAEQSSTTPPAVEDLRWLSLESDRDVSHLTEDELGLRFDQGDPDLEKLM